MRTIAELSEYGCYQMLRQVQWPNGIVCPYRGCQRITTHSKSVRTPRRRYLCLTCRRTFTDFTGTPFARTNLPLGKWFLCLKLLRHGYTTTYLAKALQVKWDTAVQMQRRLGAALARPGFLRRLRDTMEAGYG